MEAVLAIPIAMGIGYWADSRFETEPVLLLVGTVFGFATFVMRLVRMRHDIDGGSGEEGSDGPGGPDAGR